jgi:hypothetical protein
MRIRSPSTARFALLAAASCLLLSGNASALDEAGTIKTLKGTASIEREGKKLAAEPGGKVMVNDRILTAADSTIGITLRDNTLLSAGANSTLVVNRFAFNSTTHAGAVDATLKRGTLAVVSGKIAKASPENVSYKTPTVSLGVRGTEFIIETSEQESEH